MDKPIDANDQHRVLWRQFKGTSTYSWLVKQLAANVVTRKNQIAAGDFHSPEGVANAIKDQGVIEGINMTLASMNELGEKDA